MKHAIVQILPEHLGKKFRRTTWIAGIWGIITAVGDKKFLAKMNRHGRWSGEEDHKRINYWEILE